jgi:hypothetical protein
MLALLAATLVDRLPGAEIEWLNDVVVAQEQAARTSRDLLIYVTVSEYEESHQEPYTRLFKTKPFREFAAENYVCLEVDLTSKGDETARQHNSLWMRTHDLNFNAVYVADAAGVPYSRPQHRVGVEKFVARLRDLRAQSQASAEYLSRAEHAEGIDKARYLDAAFFILPREFALSHHRQLAEQIRQSDPQNRAGLRAKYGDLLQSADLKRTLAELELAYRERGGDAEEFERGLSQLEKKYSLSGAQRVRWVQMEVEALSQCFRSDDAVHLVEKTLADKSLAEKDRAGLRDNLMYSLAGIDSEAALAFLDRVLAKEPAISEVRARSCQQRATIYQQLRQYPLAIKAIDSAIAATPSGGNVAEFRGLRDALIAEQEAFTDRPPPLEDLVSPHWLPARLLKPDLLDDELHRAKMAGYRTLRRASTTALAQVQQGIGEGNHAIRNLVDAAISTSAAALELAPTAADKLPIYERRLLLWKSLESFAEPRYRIGNLPAHEYYNARYWRVDAEIQVLRTRREISLAKGK